MFSDRFGLTDAVLKGRKTMTRRLVGNHMTEDDIKAYLKGYTELADKAAPYKIGEVVAVAQSYETFLSVGELCERGLLTSAAAHNKMFVKASALPHQIRITDIKVERLQDISDEDCIKEGIYVNPNPPKWREYDPYEPWPPYVKPYKFTTIKSFCKPQFAFAYLIDKVSGKGTWERNPYVFAYSFKLIK